MKEIKDKWIRKHSALMQVYSDDNKFNENELALMRSEMKSILEFIDDLKKIQESTK